MGYYIRRYDLHNDVVDWGDIDEDQFSLTYDMCGKNDYGSFTFPVYMDMLYDDDGYVLGICIYRHMVDDVGIYVFSFEIRKGMRYCGIGSMFMGIYKGMGRVGLSTLPESRIFYEKNGFESIGDSRMLYK
jgi:hypothetical protein